MAENLGNITLNRAGNAVAIAPRLVGTAGIAGLDLFNTLDNLPRQSYEVAMRTRTRIKEMRAHALSKGSVLQKTANSALATVLSPTLVPLEWAVRSVVEPVRNGLKNVRGVTSNFFKNIWNSVQTMFSKNKVPDFKFQHTETTVEKNTITKKNRFSRLLFGKKSYS